MYGGCFFLFKIIEQLQKDYSGLFRNSNGNNKRDGGRDEQRQGVSGFFEQWGWDYSISSVVADTNLTEEKIYDWNVIRFYNKLCYLKDKGKFEIEVNGNRK